MHLCVNFASLSLLLCGSCSEASPTTAFVRSAQPTWTKHVQVHQPFTKLKANSADSSGSKKVNKGFRLLELTNNVIPQTFVVKTAKFGWKQVWKTMLKELAPQSPNGTYVRPSYGFTNTGEDFLPANPIYVESPKLFHLYVGNACPWCHRALLALVLTGLSDFVGVTHMDDDPERASRGGWAMPRGMKDPVFGATDLRGVYEAAHRKTYPDADGQYEGRCTAPLVVAVDPPPPYEHIRGGKVKWRGRGGTLFNNESKDIVKFINNLAKARADYLATGGEKNEAAAVSCVDLYPPGFEEEIDRVNEDIYSRYNNAVYR